MRLKNKVLSVATSLALVSSLCPLSLAFAAEGEGTGVSNGTQDQLVVLESDAVTKVKGLIKALPDAMDVTSAQPVGRYDQQILEAQDALNALSAEERAEVVTALAGSQPYGRVLESALWAMAALGAVDDSTALPDGTYDGSSEPKLESVYSKGQSTSGRDRPWSVLSVTVKDGHATACITVQSSTYTYVVWGGQRYYNAAASGNCVFEGLPIDLNATQSFTGYSTSMTTEIAFQLTNSIDESYVPEDPEPGPVDPDPDDPEPGPGPVDPEPIDPEPGPGPVDPDPIDPVDPDPVPTALDAAKRLIEALPRDAYAVTSADVTKISAAQMMYDSLSEADKKALLDQYVEGSVSYARGLELAVWAMKSLNPIDNSTKLAEGTYTLSDGALMSDLGLSVSKRQNNWKVAKIEVAGGKAMATLVRVGGNTPIESFYVGGVMYENVDTAGGSTVIVPIDLNSDMYFSTQAKGASEETVPLVYHLATPFDEKGAKPDPEKEPETNEDEPGGDEPSGDKPSGDKPSGGDSKDDDDKPQQIPSANSGNNSGAAGTMGALGGTTKKTAATASTTAAKASSEAEEKELADGGLKAEAAAAGIAEKAGGAAAGGENLSLVAGFGLLLFVAAGAGGFTVVFRKREEH